MIEGCGALHTISRGVSCISAIACPTVVCRVSVMAVLSFAQRGLE